MTVLRPIRRMRRAERNRQKNKKRHSLGKTHVKVKKDKKMKRTGKRDKARPDQIAFYKGDTKAILNKMKSILRVHLATVNSFPSIEQVLRVVRKAFPKVCKDILGRGDGGALFNFHLFKFINQI